MYNVHVSQLPEHLQPMKRPPTYLGVTLQKYYFVYILANEDKTILYTGVTSNVRQRIAQHKAGTGSAFTKRHNLGKLVYYEILTDPQTAIAREKQIKASSRSKRIDLVNSINADWNDLYPIFDKRATMDIKTTKTKQRTQPASDLPPELAKPAQRALAGAGITSLARLAKLSEADVKQLHGIGPNAVALLRQALTAKGLSFAQDKKKK